jgi:hypothetical protein
MIAMEKNVHLCRTAKLLSFLLIPAMLNAEVVCVDDSNLSTQQNGSAQYPFRSIQSAIMTAPNGDTIRVATGAYAPIDNMGRSYVIAGGYQGGTSAAYEAGTGGDFLAMAPDPSLTVISGGPDSVGVFLSRFDFDPFSFTLANLTVSNSRKGILCDVLVSWPHVENVTITGCVIENNGQPGVTTLGGGIVVMGNGHRLLNNIIRNNQGGRGAGISGNTNAGDSLWVEGNIIENNIGYDDHCAGLYLGGYAVIRNNIISGNQLQNSYGWGGGVLILGTAYMSGNVIKDNYCPSYGGAVFVDEGGILYMDHELIFGNSTSIEGAAIAADYGDPGSSYVYLTNCTIANNHSPAGAGLDGNAVFLDVSSFGTVTNCILYGNGDDFHVTTGSDLTVTYTLSEEAVAGTGNFQTDPLFADTANADYHLRSTAGRYDPIAQSWVTDAVQSPAIDAGVPASPYANEPSPNGNRINLGYDGNTAYASMSNSTGVPANGANHAFIQAYPDPVQSELTVTVPDDGSQQRVLRIFNGLGMEVLERRMGRTAVLPETARFADGTYVLRITSSSGETHSKKFVVRKSD